MNARIRCLALDHKPSHNSPLDIISGMSGNLMPLHAGVKRIGFITRSSFLDGSD